MVFDVQLLMVYMDIYLRLATLCDMFVNIVVED